MSIFYPIVFGLSIYFSRPLLTGNGRALVKAALVHRLKGCRLNCSARTESSNKVNSSFLDLIIVKGILGTYGIISKKQRHKR